MNICMLDALPNAKSVQRHMRWVVDAWWRAGGAVHKNVSIPGLLRRVAGHAAAFSTGIKLGRLLVLSGRRMETAAWPWCYFYEIVPVLWDVWPECIAPLVKFVRRNRVKLMFVTASCQVEKLRTLLPDVQVEWMPEGIDVESYPNGGSLKDRQFDIIEYGRRKVNVHDDLLAHKFKRTFNHLYSKERIMFPKFEDMTAAIRSAKISICYPQCDTNPAYAGDVETLTQRYWEAMSSGTLVAGRAPQELVDLCGYNPVITLGDHPAEQLEAVLDDIDQGKYQDLADRNRLYVEKHADWSVRIAQIKKALSEGR